MIDALKIKGQNPSATKHLGPCTKSDGCCEITHTHSLPSTISKPDNSGPVSAGEDDLQPRELRACIRKVAGTLLMLFRSSHYSG